MKTSAIAFTALLAVSQGLQAADSPPAAPGDACLMLNNRILGPRSNNRPLPLLRGDPAHGFTPACSVTWQAISPKNQPLPVESCFRGSLVQIPNDTACGTGTGKLWVGTRWVVTSADLARTTDRLAVCQQLETGAWAGTRAFSIECKPRSKELAGAKSDGSTTPTKPAPSESTPPKG